MPLVRPGIRRLFHLGLLGRGRAERDVDEEMRFHIERRAEQLVRSGLDPVAARAQARHLFAQSAAAVDRLYASAEERNENMALRERWDAVVQDIRYAARRLAREPMVTAFILLTLALGLGANVTAFSLVDRLLLRGPAFVREPDRLVRLYRRVDTPPVGVQTAPWIPYPTYTNLRTGMRTVGAIAAYRVDDAIVGRGSTAQRSRVGRVSGNLFALLGVRPLRGRLFGETDAGSGGSVALVNERLWRTRLGADPGVIGQTIVVGDVPLTIVGIVPAEFSGPDIGRVDVWTMLDDRSARTQNWKVVARVRPGVAASAVSEEAQAVHLATRDAGPRWIREATMLVAPIRYDDTARESVEATMARWMAAISAIILLITCANVANLLLARVARRRRELATRVALGSGRARVVRLIVLEGVLLAAGAAVVSLVVALVTEPLVQRALFPDGAWTFSLRDGRLLAAVALVAVVAAALVAIVPAVQAGGLQLTSALRAGERGATSRSRMRPVLTVMQAALSVVLLVGAGLFLRSLARVRAVDLGIEPDRVVMVDAHYARAAMSFDEMLRADRERARRLLDAARRVPGVEHASIGIAGPLSGGSASVGLWVSGRDSIPALPGGGPYANAVSDDYFATIGTPLLRGRAFTAADREGSDPVVIVNETMARVLWPRSDAIGQCVRVHDAGAPCTRVVGVAADVHRSGLREEASMQYYLPLGQERGFGGTSLLIRPAGRAVESWPALQRALLAADPAVTAVELRLLSRALDAELRPLRLGMVTFGLSALLAVVVAALGLYSVMAYAVAWRTHEIGVRIALGASAGQVTRLVVSGGASLAAVGIAAGLILSLVGRRWIEPQLFETSGADPLVLGTVVCVLQAVALLAGWLPARRASRIDPLVALWSE